MHRYSKMRIRIWDDEAWYGSVRVSYCNAYSENRTLESE